MHLPQISVILSAYNAEQYLSAAISSILNQTFKSFELIIIEDGSKDQTLRIIESFSDPRIRCIKNEVNRGLIYSLNLGVQIATGKYLARMDADDIAEPNRLFDQFKFLESHPEVGILGSGVTIISKSGRKRVKYFFPESHLLINWAMHFFCPLAHPTVVMRSSVINGIKPYDMNAMHAEDYDLWQRLLEKCDFSNLSVPLLRLRKHDANISDVQNSANIKISQVVARRQIEKTLNSVVPISIVRCILSLGKVESSSAPMAINVIQELRMNFLIKNNNIPPLELSKINCDTALRIFVIGLRNINQLEFFRWFFTIIRLNPFIFIDVFFRWMKKTLSKGAITLL